VKPRVWSVVVVLSVAAGGVARADEPAPSPVSPACAKLTDHIVAVKQSVPNVHVRSADGTVRASGTVAITKKELDALRGHLANLCAKWTEVTRTCLGKATTEMQLYKCLPVFRPRDPSAPADITSGLDEPPAPPPATQAAPPPPKPTGSRLHVAPVKTVSTGGIERRAGARAGQDINYMAVQACYRLAPAPAKVTDVVARIAVLGNGTPQSVTLTPAPPAEVAACVRPVLLKPRVSATTGFGELLWTFRITPY
jgi:hypothetical protein